MATVDRVQLATEKIEAIEAWADQGFPDGLPDLKLRGMPCEASPLNLIDPPPGTPKSRTESKGVVVRFDWVGRSGPGTKEIVLRFNPKGRGVSKDPTSMIYVVREEAEELLLSERVPGVELEAEVNAQEFVYGILRRTARKDAFCAKLFQVYRDELAEKKKAEEEGTSAGSGSAPAPEEAPVPEAALLDAAEAEPPPAGKDSDSSSEAKADGSTEPAKESESAEEGQEVVESEAASSDGEPRPE